jgi:hypothetical protein
MEASSRVQRSQPEDTTLGPDSSYVAPETREKVSARISTKTIKKMRAIVRIWQTQTRVEKEAEERAEDPKSAAEREKAAERVEAAVAAVDLTHVIDELLKSAADRELQPWGGLPDTPEKLEHVLKLVEKQARK